MSGDEVPQGDILMRKVRRLCLHAILQMYRKLQGTSSASPNLTAVNVAGSPSAEQWRTAGHAGFAGEIRQGRPSQQADARPLPPPAAASSPTASTSGREVADLRQQVADLQAQNRQLLQMTRQQQATITLFQACTSYLVLWPSQTPVAAL